MKTVGQCSGTLVVTLAAMVYVRSNSFPPTGPYRSTRYLTVMTKLSAFVTTFNNARTLAACLRSLEWADEIVVLDSFSTDATPDIAREFGCEFFQHRFLGYGKQKQLAMEKTKNRWVLLLDADEMLSGAAQTEIQALLAAGPLAAGYELCRQEQVFWRMSDTAVRMNHYLRLLDKEKALITDMPIHAAPEVVGPVKRLRAPFYHFGETDIHTKVEKINAYSSGLVEEKRARQHHSNPLIMIFYPPWFFLRSYFFKRGFLNGWAGFIASTIGAFYVFLKYAKVYERGKVLRVGQRLMPPGAPLSGQVTHDEAAHVDQKN